MTHALRRYRSETDTTLRDLAEKVGVSKGALSKVETGKMQPSLSLMRRLVKATGGAVTLQDFDDFLDQPDIAQEANHDA